MSQRVTRIELIELFNELEEAKNNQQVNIAGVRSELRKMGYDGNVSLNDKMYLWISERIRSQNEAAKYQDLLNEPVFQDLIFKLINLNDDEDNIDEILGEEWEIDMSRVNKSFV